MAKISILLVVAAFIACAVAGPVPSSRFFQGDIKLTEAQYNLLNGITPRTGLIDTFYRWHRNVQGHPVMPYIFDPAAGFSKNQLYNFIEMVTWMKICSSSRTGYDDARDERYRKSHLHPFWATHSPTWLRADHQRWRLLVPFRKNWWVT